MKEKGKNSLSEKKLKQALIKKALGYDVEEIIEEYVGDKDGLIVLSKKKVTKKNVPPDISAIKILMDGQAENLSNLTDQELEEEKQRLLSLIQKKEKIKDI